MLKIENKTALLRIAVPVLVFGFAAAAYANFLGKPGKLFSRFQVIGVVENMDVPAKTIRTAIVGSNFMKSNISGDTATIGGIEGTSQTYPLTSSGHASIKTPGISDRKLELKEVPVGALTRLEMRNINGVDSVEEIRVQASNGIKIPRTILESVDLDTRMVTMILGAKGGGKSIKNYLPGLGGKKVSFYVLENANGDYGAIIRLNTFAPGEAVALEIARVSGEILYATEMRHTR